MISYTLVRSFEQDILVNPALCVQQATEAPCESFEYEQDNDGAVCVEDDFREPSHHVLPLAELTRPQS